MFLSAFFEVQTKGLEALLPCPEMTKDVGMSIGRRVDVNGADTDMEELEKRLASTQLSERSYDQKTFQRMETEVLYYLFRAFTNNRMPQIFRSGLDPIPGFDRLAIKHQPIEKNGIISV